VGAESSKQSGTSAEPSQRQPNKLFITLIDGEGALNDIRTRTAREPIVEVDDENHGRWRARWCCLPWTTAEMAARLPALPELRVFPSQPMPLDALSVRVSHHAPQGQYKINVHASKGPAVADTVITMENVLTAGSGSSGSIPPPSYRTRSWSGFWAASLWPEPQSHSYRGNTRVFSNYGDHRNRNCRSAFVRPASVSPPPQEALIRTASARDKS